MFLIFDLNNCMTNKEEPGIDRNLDVDLFKLDLINDMKSSLFMRFVKTDFTFIVVRLLYESF